MNEYVTPKRETIDGIITQETGIPLGTITPATHLINSERIDRSYTVVQSCNRRFGQNKKWRHRMKVADLYKLFGV
jgi:hypothetical protein